MDLGSAISVYGVPIRLTEERWEHILEGHAEFSYGDHPMILEAIENPAYILRGRRGSLIAVAVLGRKAYLHVFYREVSGQDGFVITAAIRDASDQARILWRQ